MHLTSHSSTCLISPRIPTLRYHLLPCSRLYVLFGLLFLLSYAFFFFHLSFLPSFTLAFHFLLLFPFFLFLPLLLTYLPASLGYFRKKSHYRTLLLGISPAAVTTTCNPHAHRQCIHTHTRQCPHFLQLVRTYARTHAHPVTQANISTYTHYMQAKLCICTSYDGSSIRIVH